MTLCAGLCYYKGPGTCLIRLSEPLLKYRSREDMINTLLHEMIHAFLFLLHGPRFADHDGHGPEFLKEAARINRRAGTNITIYHNFHDEVDHYRQHVWQCDGPCREKPPFFGIVKRSMNRAPQPADLWWHDHQLTCGGKFHKVSEPENVTKKKKKKKSHKITEFFDCGEASGSSSSQKRKRTDE
ncbi:SprT-like family-domain-containing protein [Dichotomocladium elegans]|nr:SprT-like family-domain-containing protein [Dichotomocladium elegans]